MIQTDAFSSKLRKRLILPAEQKVLIAELSKSVQSQDLSTPVNCNGYGRIRHFRIQKHSDWSTDPLPNLPACKALRIQPDEVLLTQVFQLAGCNWRCWNCFVDYDRLSANVNVSAYFSSDELINLFMAEAGRPSVIDLSGGEPDLVPEWNLWMMQALEKRGLRGQMFLWTDDNLSNVYLWKYLSVKQQEYMRSFPSYSRVGCFKGFDNSSFVFNTLAKPELFDTQFDIFRRLLQTGFDMYAYVTFTTLPADGLRGKIAAYVDRLQEIHPNLPLRTVPLKIEVFTPTRGRITADHNLALKYQHEVHQAWLEEVGHRFSKEMREMPICDIPLTAN